MTTPYDAPEYAALLAAVCAAPADDAPRLVLADWLDERGEHERAEFIRKCVEQARRGERPCPRMGDGHVWGRCDWCQFHESRFSLAKVLGLRGLGLPVDLPVDGAWFSQKTWERSVSGYWLDRGFAGAIKCPAADFLAHADALLWSPAQNRPCPPTAQPITHVRLTTWPEAYRFKGRPWAVDGWAERLDGVKVLVARIGEGWEEFFSTNGLVPPNGHAPGPPVAELLARRWPGVTFELPPPPVNSAEFMSAASHGARLFVGGQELPVESIRVTITDA